MICSSGKNRKNINIIWRILTWSEGKALASRRILYRFGVGLKNDNCNKMDLLRKALVHNFYIYLFYSTLLFYNLQHLKAFINYKSRCLSMVPFPVALFLMNYKKEDDISSLHYWWGRKFRRKWKSDKYKFSSFT